jgi:hypothetical protein
VVVFEDVQFSSYTSQTQLWASYRTAVWLAFGKTSLIECVDVKTLKKFACNGNATKEMMAYAAKKRLGPLDPNLDDNAIDALWIFTWARATLRRTPKDSLSNGF